MADVCVLSSTEVGQLNNYKIFPNHANHTHIPYDEAVKALKDETHEMVEGINGGRCYLTPVKLFFLRKIKSGSKSGIPIVQRVVSNRLEHLLVPRF